MKLYSLIVCVFFGTSDCVVLGDGASLSGVPWAILFNVCYLYLFCREHPSLRTLLIDGCSQQRMLPWAVLFHVCCVVSVLL